MSIQNGSTKLVVLALGLAFVVAAVLGLGVSGLLLNIHDRQVEARQYPLMLNKVSDDNVDPEEWGKNFPLQYDSYKAMVETDKATLFGGNLPYSKLIRYPQLTSLWAGYPFSADFNEDRGHYYTQIDQMETMRVNKEWLNSHGFPKFTGQPAACMNCHSGWTPKLIRDMGWEKFNSTPYMEVAAKLKQEHGDGVHGAQLGGTCADCHSPKDMSLRVTRPAYINAMVERGYKADPEHGIEATRREMRSHVCQQCHVEYYFYPNNKVLTFPWSKWPKDKPLRIEMIEAYYDEARAKPDGFKFDWMHKETGAPMLKMQHPEAELFSSGVHAQAGVACADCHMPYQRAGALKVTNHKISSPLLNINASCQTCHAVPEAELKARVDNIQRSTAASLRESENALLALISDLKRGIAMLKETESFKSKATPEEQEAWLASVLGDARDSHRRASMRWDFISSENSTGFHSPQEAARVLAQSMDIAREGQLKLQIALGKLGLELVPATGAVPLPAAGQPISEHKPPVGAVPPAEIVAGEALGL